MKKFIIILSIIFSCQFAYAQNTKYNIFATYCMNLDTGEFIEDVKQNFMTITQKETVLLVGESLSYELYNQKEWAEGFKIYSRYDAIDKYQQRCTILFQTNNSADWSTKYMIVITYENREESMVYLSREPEKI